ncbi:signal peptidase I [Modestobacter sp. DSM 44400]|uniref:signal peptidase I n=1 Tax=Modestobacter sp. DSM 44400 TaxID=1550230 RepID=UPI000899D5FB|nr:signal peptidase I [Modestobacter sp. DSM 44400]SDX68523.1 signal peptidase I [Modestobacter sp. DSM 44400]
MSTDRPAGPADAAGRRTRDEAPAGPEQDGVSAAASSSAEAAPAAARSSRFGRRRPAEAEKKGSLLRELPVLLVIAFVLALLVKTFLVQAFFIPSGSMEQTLHGCTGCTGDRVLVNKIPYWFGEPEPGDIVVFKGPDTWDPEISVAEPSNWFSGALLALGRAVGVAAPSEDDYVKRVIATAGQTVQCCDAEGRVTVDGQPLDEPYIFEPTPIESRAFGPVIVPKGRLWVMGDHRSISGDSTKHITDKYSGTIAVDDVIGKAALIVWPLDRITVLDSPDIQGQDQAAASAEGAPMALGTAAVAVPYAVGLVGAVPLTARRRRRRSGGGATRMSGPSRRPPGTGWRRIRPAPRTRPGREPSGD